MLFNSLGFLIFLPVVFALYWAVGPRRWRLQNIILLLASYYFYACWDYRFLSLLIFSTILDYLSGIMIHSTRSPSMRKGWLWTSILVNVGFLGVFKYYNFFVSSFADALRGIGYTADPVMLHVILPVGISFYTFHGLSYVLDIYHERIRPERNIVHYSVFVSFFPLLVAGPIERATHLLPQIVAPRTFDAVRAADGLRQILWGLFKKMVIADACAVYVNTIFNGHTDMSGSTLFLGAIFFSFQIYCDFSGYSDIALGVARLFGIELLRNFSFPYFSRDIAEFWRRWHISLSSWFRDYLYIPLGGNTGGNWKRLRNTVIVFGVSGFWHGANWTFIIWGLLNALYIIPSVLRRTNRQNVDIVAAGRSWPNGRELVMMVRTYLLVVLAWVFFRSSSVEQAFDIHTQIFSSSFLTIPYFPRISESAVTVFFIAVCLVMEWRGREHHHALHQLSLHLPSRARWAVYYVLIGVILYFGGTKQEFIYFQF